MEPLDGARVAGVKRNHQKFLITIEELIVLTVALADVDPDFVTNRWIGVLNITISFLQVV